ncbi:preprotein translocase subunit YajC [candidate division NPL-UPA2 bacterium]|nr:preprotein translocase subunit YajC [candidate division NPL-UPA2 bacterium]
MFAEAYAMGTAPGGPGQGPSGLGMFFPLIIIIFIFYILIWLPQKKERRQKEEMRANLKKGDKVITGGGIHGIVTNVKEDTVTIKVADNVKMEFSKSVISQVIKKTS